MQRHRHSIHKLKAIVNLFFFQDPTDVGSHFLLSFAFCPRYSRKFFVTSPAIYTSFFHLLQQPYVLIINLRESSQINVSKFLFKNAEFEISALKVSINHGVKRVS